MIKKIYTLIGICFGLFAFGFAQIPDGYYSSAAGLEGEALKSALHEIINGHTELTYDDLWTVLKETDEDPLNSANFILIYTGRSIAKTSSYPAWNREHVWAKSHGDFSTSPPAGTDAHHLRPADVSVNSARGSRDFDNGGNLVSETSGCYADDDNDSWEPRDAVKGDVARMMFYMATRYDGDAADHGGLDLELVDYTNTSGPIFGKLSTLLEWNEFDPVDDFERHKNEIVYLYQQNRNPFIDKPEYVNCIWGTCSGLRFTSTPISVVYINETYLYDITYAVELETENIECTEKPAWLNFSADTETNTAKLTGTPTVSNLGSHTITFKLSEGDESVTQTYQLEVKEPSSEIELINEPFTTCNLIGWETISVSAPDRDWTCDGVTASINAYNSANDDACNDWLISPEINLNETDGEILSFKTWTQYTDPIIDPELKLYVSSDYSGDPTTATWNEIQYNYPAENTQLWTESGDIDLSQVVGTAVRIGFNYESSGAGGGTSTFWKLDDVLLIGDRISNVHVPVSQIGLYPNPASDILNIQTEEIGNISIYNIQGIEIYRASLTSQIDISSYSNGIYFVQIVNNAGQIFSSRFVKQ